MRYSLQLRCESVKIKRTLSTYDIVVMYVIAHTQAATLPFMAADLTAGDRLYELRDRAGLSLREAAARSGLSYGHIREIEKLPGKAENMTANTMRGLAVAYGVSVEQIVRIATGRPLPITNEPVDIVHNDSPKRLPGGLVMVPVYGYANGGRPTEYGIPVDPELVRGENTRAYQVEGNSMDTGTDDGIKDGEWVLVDTSLTKGVTGRVFLLEIIGDGMTVKRLRQFDGEWRFTSDNPEDGESWRGDQVRVVGQVYGKVNFKAIH